MQCLKPDFSVMQCLTFIWDPKYTSRTAGCLPIQNIPCPLKKNIILNHLRPLRNLRKTIPFFQAQRHPLLLKRTTSYIAYVSKNGGFLQFFSERTRSHKKSSKKHRTDRCSKIGPNHPFTPRSIRRILIGIRVRVPRVMRFHRWPILAGGNRARVFGAMVFF